MYSEAYCFVCKKEIESPEIYYTVCQCCQSKSNPNDDLKKQIMARDMLLEDILLNFKSRFRDNLTAFEFIQKYGKESIQGLIASKYRSI